MMKLNGMILGKRIIQWIGSIKFEFPSQNMVATITFCKDDSAPSDYFVYEINLVGVS